VSSSPLSFSSHHTVTLDNEALYLDEKLARALGWTPEAGVDGVKLSLHGWKSHYFVITRAGTDSGGFSYWKSFDFVLETNIQKRDWRGEP